MQLKFLPPELRSRVETEKGVVKLTPATERLVQLFPFTFWQETAIVLGIVAILLALLVAWVADAKAGEASEQNGGDTAETATDEAVDEAVEAVEASAVAVATLLGDEDGGGESVAAQGDSVARGRRWNDADHFRRPA